MDKTKTFILKNSLSLSLSLNYYCSTANHPIEKADNNDPILTLIKNYEDILDMKIYNGNGNITKFLYFNKEKVHSILYKKNEVINLEYNKNNKNLIFYFYLTLLIRENPNILNYKYDEEYITSLNEDNINDKNDKNQLNQIIKAKFIIELTQEYKLDYDYFDDDKGKDLDKIIEININIIKKNIDIFKELNCDLDINKIIFFPIDKLYNDIIIGLIKSKKFNNFNYMNHIVTQLNLEQIDITENMYKTLENFLTNPENELLINNYVIKDEKDLNDNLKINFSYFLIKYIYKNDFLINSSEFISSLRESIKNILNKNKNSLKKIESNKYQKIRYIINIFCLMPKKFIQNNLDNYYQAFITFKEGKNKNNKDENKVDNQKIDHEELYIIELINQIYNVEEFKNEYNEILGKEEKYKENKDKENGDFDSLCSQLNFIDKAENYKDKFKNIIKNKKFKEQFRKNKILSESLLKELFNFYNCEEEEKISRLENRLVFEDSINFNNKWVENINLD